jgi:hypothetical protein
MTAFYRFRRPRATAAAVWDLALAVAANGPCAGAGRSSILLFEAVPGPMDLRRSRLAVLFLLAAPATRAGAAVRPFAEYETVKYVVMSAGLDYQTEDVKRAILSRLPDGVTAVVYGKSSSDLGDFKTAESGLGGRSTARLLIVKPGESFWARDSWPYPVVDGGRLSLVAARYYPGFEPDAEAAAYLHAEMRGHSYYFEHGNLAANRAGVCFVVADNFSPLIPDSAFADYYGCRRTIRLPFVTGIGHADEVVKFVSDDVVLTDRPDFVARIEAEGLRAVLLPEAKLPEELVRRGVFSQRSYVNSLLVNGTVFVPTFGLPTDDEALRTYASLHLSVVPVPAAYVADYGGGALHCMTMTYPDTGR